MNQSSLWDVIGGAASFVALLLTIFLEWPRIQKRFRATASILPNLLRYLLVAGMVGGFFILGAGIFFSDVFWGQLGLWIYIFSMGIWLLLKVIESIRQKNRNIRNWILLLLLALNLYVVAYAYYHTSI